MFCSFQRSIVEVEAIDIDDCFHFLHQEKQKAAALSCKRPLGLRHAVGESLLIYEVELFVNPIVVFDFL